MTQAFKEIFGDTLLTEPIDTLEKELPSPDKLRRKVIIKVSSFLSVFRWFKFTLKPPYSGASERSLLAIWDTSHWNFFVKFGLKTA